MKYIDADRLKAEIEKNTPNHLMLMVYRDHILALIDSLQQEQPDIDDIKREWYNKGYLKGRKESNIPARELGLPKSCDMQEQPEVFDTVAFQKGVQEGRRLEREDALTIADIEKFRREAAMMAMQGILVNSYNRYDAALDKMVDILPINAAFHAVAYADALIEELKKEK